MKGKRVAGRVPNKIKELVRRGRVHFSSKARQGRLEAGLSVEDVLNTIMHGSVHKKMKDPLSQANWVYVIYGKALDGRPVYTQGKILAATDAEAVYFVITSHEREE